MEDLTISLAGGDGEDLGSLSTWLSEERELRGAVHQVAKPIAEGELGSPMSDAISIALGAGGAGTVLASSLIVWLQTRRTNAKITVTSGKRSVTLDIKTVEDVRPLLEQIVRARDDS